MKTKTIIFATIAFLLFFASFLRAELPTTIARLSKPMIPQQACGQYLPKLKEIEKLYTDANYFDFFNTSTKLRQEIEKSKKYGGWSYDKEETALFRWIEYYQLSAPMLTIDEIEASRKDVLIVDIYTGDIEAKILATESLCFEKTKEVAQMFSLDPKKYLRQQVENLAIILAYFNKVYTYTFDTNAHEKEDEIAMKRCAKVFVELEKIYPLYHKTPDGGYMSVGSHALSYLSERESLWQSRRYWLQRKIWNAESRMVNEYIRKLVECFPNQGRTVQSYIKKIGLYVLLKDPIKDPRYRSYLSNNPYPPNLDLTLAIERAIDRNPETEWAFVGLYPPGKARGLSTEWCKKSNAEVNRLWEEDKRDTQRQEARNKEFQREYAEKNNRKQGKIWREIEAARAESQKRENAKNSSIQISTQTVTQVPSQAPDSTHKSAPKEKQNGE